MSTETIPEYLARMRRKDREKGHDGGWRSTAEVAEYFGITTKEARKQLNRLWEGDQIDSARDGNKLIWAALA